MILSKVGFRMATGAAIVLLTAALSIFGQASKVSWSRAITVEPVDGHGPGWFLMGVQQDEEHLVAILGYGKALEQNKTSAPLVVSVTEESNGGLWLSVSLEAKYARSAGWSKMETQQNRGKPKKISIAPGEMRFHLLANLDPVKALLDRAEEVRITFDNGEKISFPASYLRADK